MLTWTNIALMIYFAFVSILGTLGNGIILLAYGNRWNSSKSTSVVFILILACFDLWTCLIVAPIFAVMEYREFEVPTLLCRFYSFSKCLLISSSLIMSFIALDRFLNIALPHHRLLHPRRVKFLLTLFILIGVGLGIPIALAFSSAPYKETYLATYYFVQSEEPDVLKNASDVISLTLEQKNVTSDELNSIVQSLVNLPFGVNLTNMNLSYISTHERCFADTSIISEPLREILKHVTNKCFFTSVGIVTILYTITFILALQRQNPRIRALKRSLNVLNKFNAYPSINNHPLENNSYQRHHHHPPVPKQRTDSIASYLPLYPSMKTRSTTIGSKHLSIHDNQQYEMASFISNDDLDDQHVLNTPKQDFPLSTSEATSDDLPTSHEKFSSNKQVSFQVENNDDQPQLPFLSQIPDVNSNPNNDTYYKFPCPCSTTRQLLIKFHFAQPTFDINQWLCYCCMKKPTPTIDDQPSTISNPIEEEGCSVLPRMLPASNNNSINHHHSANSDILRRQLYRHRLKQIRMASTFLLITVSFVLFYLPSILTAERMIQSPMIIYYLYLCTHALNPIIYCFMNISLRAYICSMFRCQKKQRRSFTAGTTTTVDR